LSSGSGRTREGLCESCPLPSKHAVRDERGVVDVTSLGDEKREVEPGSGD
jgi:hypothetical protein